MLYLGRIQVSEEIDINKTSESKYCDICHYLNFLNKKALNFKQMSGMDAMIFWWCLWILAILLF